jgi:hypothetical protein
VVALLVFGVVVAVEIISWGQASADGSIGVEGWLHIILISGLAPLALTAYILIFSRSLEAVLWGALTIVAMSVAHFWVAAFVAHSDTHTGTSFLVVEFAAVLFWLDIWGRKARKADTA